nr:nucleoside triphosphate pyrophosphohydrolase [Maliibacterium massiliense]
MHTLWIVGLGTDASTLTLGAAEALKSAARRILRTGRHDAAQYLAQNNLPFETLDDLYETCEDFDALQQQASERVLAAARADNVCYAVPGAGDVTDATVRAIAARARDAGVALRFVAGVSQASCAQGAAAQVGWRMDMPRAGVRVLAVDDLDTAALDVRDLLVVPEVDGALRASQVKLKLGEYYPDAHTLYCTAGEACQAVPLYALDRQRAMDHRTCVVVPPLAGLAMTRYGFEQLLEVMRILRGPGGCPWDREQTHASLKPYLIEEAYETLEAIDLGDAGKMTEELGDVLLQVVFHAQVGADRGAFDIRDVTTGVCKKMIERHPHIFGDAHADTPEEVLVNWEKIKKRAKRLDRQADVLADVPHNLPALMRAYKVQQKAADVGFDWDDAQGALDKLQEELRELSEACDAGDQAAAAEEMGDALFAIANVARLLNIRPELALGAACEKFIARFGRMEDLARSRGFALEALDLPAMDALWEEIKRAEPLAKKED